jgi:hypothetical protein
LLDFTRNLNFDFTQKEQPFCITLLSLFMKNNFYLRSKILLLSLITFVCIDASAQSISSNSPVCQGKNLQLTSSGGVSYSWSGPNGFSSTLQNPQILNATLPSSGVYSVAISDASSNVSTATTNVVINPTPIAVATSNTACEGMSVVLSSVNANPVISSGLSYTWSGSNGFTSTFQNPVLANVSTARSGIYTVTISTAQACTATATSSLNVNPTPASPSVQNYVSCAEDAPFTLSATPSAANMQLLWYGNNATGGVSSTVSPTFFPIVAGITFFYVSQKNNATGCESARSAILVTVNPKPFPPIVTNKTYSQGEVATSLTATSSPAFTLFWYGMSSSGGVGSVVAPIPNTSIIGTTDYYVSNKDNLTACESNRSKITVTVNPNVVIAAPQISTNKTKLCDGENAILTAAGCAGTITWSNGFTGNSISINSAGTYNAFCTVGGNQSPNSENIVITTLSRNPITISSQNGQLCLNTAITLTSSVCQEGTILWNNGATGTSIQVSTAGTYAAQCINPCGTSPNSNILTISQSGGVPSAPVISSNKNVLCDGEAAVLTASGCAGTVIWNNGMTPSSIQITQSGTYTAICRNQCGDSNSSNPVIIRTSFTPAAPTVSTTKTLICTLETATLTASGCNGTIQWNNGMTPSTIQVSIAGTYTAICQNICGNSQSSNTVVINSSTTPSSPTISANKVILCNGETATLTATGCSGMVQWSNGMTPNSIQLSFAGTYTATCVNACGTSIASMPVVLRTSTSPNIPIITTSNAIICGQATVTLTASNCNGTVVWNNAQTANQINVSSEGTYSAQCQNICGQSVSSNTLTIVRNNSNCSATTVCSGSNLTLTNTTVGTQYSWAGPNGFSSTLQNPTIIHASPSNTGIYTSTVIDVNNNTSTATTNVVINQAPIAFVIGTTVCQGSIINLAAYNTNTAIATGTNYFWTGPSNFTSVAQTPTILNASIANGGVYIVTLTTPNGCTATASANVVVNTTPLLNIASNTPICEGNTFIINSSVSGGSGFVYNWTGPNGFSSTQAGINIANVQASQAGTYQVSVRNSNGCSASTFINVAINTTPTPPIVQDIVACKSVNSLTLSATANAGHELLWYGINSSGGIGSTIAPIRDTSSIGVITYYVSQRNATTGCESARAALMTQILPKPSIPLVYNKIMCQNSAADSLIAISSDGNALIWYGMNSSGGVGSTVKPQHNPIISGVFKYYVTQKNALGCESDRAEFVVTVYAKPLSPTANNITLCQGDAPIILSATALQNHTLYWDNYSPAAPIHNPTIVGNFNYYVRQKENTNTVCYSDPQLIVVTVQPKPTVSITANTPLNTGQTLQFGATVSVGTTFSWSGPNGFSATIQNPKIINVASVHAGIYTLTGKLNGCSTTATIQVTVVSPNIKLYDNALKTNWSAYTSFTNRNLNNTNPVQSGTKSISVQHNKASGYLTLATNIAQSLAGMTHLKFWIHGGTAGSQKIAIKINNITTKYNVVATKNSWTLITIPLSYFGNPSSLNEIYFINNASISQPVYYLDNIYLAGSANARIASSEDIVENITDEVNSVETSDKMIVEKVDFNIYPNPVVKRHSMLNLSLQGFEKDANLNIELLDSQGNNRKVYKLNMNDQEKAIEIPTLESGAYMIRVSDGKKVALKRLIVD